MHLQAECVRYAPYRVQARWKIKPKFEFFQFKDNLIKSKVQILLVWQNGMNRQNWQAPSTAFWLDPLDFTWKDLERWPHCVLRNPERAWIVQKDSGEKFNGCSLDSHWILRSTESVDARWMLIGCLELKFKSVGKALFQPKLGNETTKCIGNALHLRVFSFQKSLFTLICISFWITNFAKFVRHSGDEFASNKFIYPFSRHSSNVHTRYLNIFTENY